MACELAAQAVLDGLQAEQMADGGKDGKDGKSGDKPAPAAEAKAEIAAEPAPVAATA